MIPTLQLGQFGRRVKAAAQLPGAAPDTIAGATSWIDFTDATTLFSANPSTLVSADGDRIICALSKANTSLALTNSGTSTTRPTYKTSVVNGCSVGRFDGADDFGNMKFIDGGHSDTGFFNLTDAYTSTGKTVILALSITTARTDTGAAYTNDMILGDGANNRCVVATYNIDASNVGVQFYNYDGSTDWVSLSVPKNTFIIVSMKHDGTDLKIRLNHGSWTTVASGTSTSITGAVIMGDGFGTNANMDVAHMATFNAAVSDADIYLVEQRFAAQLGITLS